jgi:hypothetical protein
VNPIANFQIIEFRAEWTSLIFRKQPEIRPWTALQAGIKAKLSYKVRENHI